MIKNLQRAFEFQYKVRTKRIHRVYIYTEREKSQVIRCCTYVERLLEYDPAGLRLDLKVFEVLMIGSGVERVHDGTVVVGILVRRRHAQNVRANARVLLHILHIFLRG